MSKLRKFVYFLVVIVFVGAVFASGAFFGYSQRPAVEKVSVLFGKEEAKPAEIDFSPFWIAWSTVEEKFISAGNGMDKQKMVWGAIQGMVKSLDDPYSVFFPPEEAKIFEEDINGDFEGVGMEIAIKNDVLTVVAPLKGTPAIRAGIKAGDIIVKINETLTNDMAVDEAVKLIRGPKGTSVKFSIMRKGEKELIEINVVRDVILIPVIDTEIKPGGIFIIKLYSFSGNSSELFRKALMQFVSSGNDKLILDLRGNAGGYLEASVDIASWFLPGGKIVAIERSGTGDEKIYRSRGYGSFENLNMVILVNEGSASASEILAGALQEHGIAKLIGQKTFGKGSVQELIKITNGSSLKLTIANWLTPNEKSISKNGLQPDIAVEMTNKDIEDGKDPQMDKAIEVLTK